jgi:hypothetical protein
MQLRKHLVPILLSVLLLSNLGVGLLTVQNQVILVENQEAMNSHINALNEYLFDISQELLTVEGAQGRFNVEVHLKTVHRDSDGVILGTSEHAGTLTTLGKNYIETMLGNNDTSASALWISLSNDASAPAVGWTQIPNEINANNLTRAEGSYTSTGDGVWTIDYTFTFSGTQSAQLVGLQWQSNPVSDNNLLCADQMTSASGESGDTLETTWTITIT